MKNAVYSQQNKSLIVYYTLTTKNLLLCQKKLDTQTLN